MELRKEYAEIAAQSADHDNPYVVAKKVALACQALADRPPKELTDAEIQYEWGRDGGYDNRPLTPNGITAVKRIIAAFLKKRREPETVKFRAARRNDTGEVRMLPLNFGTIEGYWQWLEPAQEFEVKLP